MAYSPPFSCRFSTEEALAESLSSNGPRSIYQNSNLIPRLYGQTKTSNIWFGFLCVQVSCGNWETKESWKKNCNFDHKASLEFWHIECGLLVQSLNGIIVTNRVQAPNLAQMFLRVYKTNSEGVPRDPDFRRGGMARFSNVILFSSSIAVFTLDLQL